MIVTVVLVLFSVRCTCCFIWEGVTCDCNCGPCFVFCEMYRLTCLLTRHMACCVTAITNSLAHDKPHVCILLMHKINF